MAKLFVSFVFFCMLCACVHAQGITVSQQWPSDLDGNGELSPSNRQDKQNQSAYPHNQSRSGVSASKSGMKMFSGGGILFYYPSSWELYPNCPSPAVAMVLKPAVGAFRDNVNFVVEDVSVYHITTLEQYVDGSIEALQSNMQGFSLLNKTQVSFAGMNGYKIVTSSVAQNGIQLKQMQFFILSGSKGYVATFTASADTYQSSLPTAEKIIGSFEINR